MNDYTPVMIIGDRVRTFREHHGLTQEDLAAKSRLSAPTIQRVERGLPVSANTIASLAAALGVAAAELTSATQPLEPYLPIRPVTDGRSLLMLLRRAGRLDFDFSELSDLAQAELVQELQDWCEARVSEAAPEAAVARVKLELQAAGLLQRLAQASLTVSGDTYKIDIYEVDDEFDSMPIVLAQWDQICAVIRLGARNKWIDRAFVMDKLGKFESPAGGQVIYPLAAGKNDV
jgi:transcriptional regulator with XRE-family HTH domain